MQGGLIEDSMELGIVGRNATNQIDGSLGEHSSEWTSGHAGKGPDRFAINEGEIAPGIKRQEGAGGTDFARTAPFEFKPMELSAGLLDQIDLLLVVGAPEPGIHKASAITVVLHAFNHTEVFPQGAHIVAQVQFIEVLDQRIANTQIKEIDLPALGDFLARVATEGA